MSSSDSLSEKSASSDEEFKVTGHINKQMSLRGRAPKNYREFEDEENNLEDEEQHQVLTYQQHQKRNLRSATRQTTKSSPNQQQPQQELQSDEINQELPNNNQFQRQSYNNDEDQDNLIAQIEAEELEELAKKSKQSNDQQGSDQNQYEEQSGIFFPEIDVILWRREKQKVDGDEKPVDGKQYEYLVKYKDYSYLHTEWLDRSEIVCSGVGVRNKLNRFDRNFEQKLLELEFEGDLEDEVNYFDQTYVEVDRILSTTELFPIIHPKKANEIKGKWSEYLVIVVGKLLNFTKDDVNYGIYFMEPVNPEKEGIPNYRRVVQQPMDLGTVINRVYLDYYKNFQQFWYELGLVFKNCRKFNKDSDCEIRILCDTLRELAIELYKQWYAVQKDKFLKLQQKDKKEEEEKNQQLQDVTTAQEQNKTVQASNNSTEVKTEMKEENSETQNQSLENFQTPTAKTTQQVSEQQPQQQKETKIEEEGVISATQGTQIAAAEIKMEIESSKDKKSIEKDSKINTATTNDNSNEKNLNKLTDSIKNQLDFQQQGQELNVEKNKTSSKIEEVEENKKLEEKEKTIEKQEEQITPDELDENGQLLTKDKKILENIKQINNLFENFASEFIQNSENKDEILKIDYKDYVNSFIEKNQEILDQFDLNSELVDYDSENPQKIKVQLGQRLNAYYKQIQTCIRENNFVNIKKINLAEEQENYNKFQAKLTIQNQRNNQKLQQERIQKQQLRQLNQRKKQEVFIKYDTTQLLNVEQIEKFNPGEYNFDWLKDDIHSIPVDQEERIYIDEEYLAEMNLSKEPDILYLVKWRNLSYLDATWEHQSQLPQDKINDFRLFNRAFDKEGRLQMINQVNRHKTLLDLINNPKKKAKHSYTYIQDLYNKLYHYDSIKNKKPMQYNLKTQPIFKDRKMLRDYQIESLNWLITSWYAKRNVILADEMGLGKTIQTIAFLHHLIQFENCRGPFLVIAPLSTLEHWKRTGSDWTNLNCVLYYDTNSIEGRTCCRAYEWFHTDISTKGTVLQTNEIYKFHIMITSYEVFLQDLQNIFINIPFQFIVIDEAHRLKNQNAKILTALKKLPCQRILLLTGTPIQNNTDELWSLLNYIEPQKFARISDFQTQFGDLSNADQIQNLHTILKPYLLRRMKEDVEQSIPPLQETIIDIEMTTIQKTLYRALYEKNKLFLSRGLSGGNFTSSLNNLEMQLRKCCNHPFLIKEIEFEILRDCHTQDQKMSKVIDCSGKMLLLEKLLQKMRNESKKVLIFSQFTQMLVIVEEYLKSKGIKYEKIDGAVKAKERQNAIDRFNNPNKKRDVFLLSTKAGGLGINLTSANVVVVYDSDWNPQNDVQAIARAHRIGQYQEVQVYRLVTAKTYEAEMFERATKKLGLDQAIFMGGNFQHSGCNIKNDDNTDDKAKLESTNNKKISKQEIEILLKKGILGLIGETEQDESSRIFREEDIDQILQKNSRIAKYSLINGTYSFSKSTFVSSQVNQSINIEDPNFWNIVLQNTETQAKKLLRQLEETPELILDDYEDQKTFMFKVSEILSQVIESKLNIVGYNADDEKNLTEILNRIFTNNEFHRTYREMATNWLYDVAKPTRRFKKLTLQEFDINTQFLKKQKQLKEKKNNEDSDGEQIFNEGDEEQNEFNEENQSDNMFNSDEEQFVVGQGKQNRRSLTFKEKENRIKKLCHYCERNKCIYFCEGPCQRGFHEQCKKKVEEGEICGLDNNNIQFEIHESRLDDEKVKKLMILNYTCKDCQNQQGFCFICKKKSKYKTKSSQKKKSAKELKESENAATTAIEKEDDLGSGKNKDHIEEEETKEGGEKADGEQQQDEKTEQDVVAGEDECLTKCSTANCVRYYHLTCLSKLKGVRYVDDHKTKFRCPLHYCTKCSISGDSMPLIQCFRCINSYHFKCYNKEKVIKLSKKIIICSKHIQQEQLQAMQQGSNSKAHQNQLKINLKSEKGQIKMENRIEETKKPRESVKERLLKRMNQTFEQNAELFISKKKQKQIEKQQKSKKKRGEEHEEEDDDNENEEVVEKQQKSKKEKKENSEEDEEESDSQGEDKVEKKKHKDKKIKIKKKVRGRPNNFYNYKKNKDGPRFTYQDFGIPEPKEFDYPNFEKDWCRYCGARISSNFTKGPWGPRTLCTIHYIEWNQKKRLNLSSYKDLPDWPINLDANTELDYMSKTKEKNSDFDPLAILLEPPKIKKLKRGQTNIEENQPNTAVNKNTENEPLNLNADDIDNNYQIKLKKNTQGFEVQNGETNKNNHHHHHHHNNIKKTEKMDEEQDSNHKNKSKKSREKSSEKSSHKNQSQQMQLEDN